MNRCIARKIDRFVPIFILISVSFACGQERQAPGVKSEAERKDPKSTYAIYLEAVKNNDLPTAKKCWVIDDDNKSKVLDVIVGYWISSRKLQQETTRKFGELNTRSILGKWNRDDVNNAAIDLTINRLETAQVTLNGNSAELAINWKSGDGTKAPAFEYGERITWFRKVGQEWRIDANRMAELQRATDFFKSGAMGPMIRDQVEAMDDAVAALEKGTLKTGDELKTYLEARGAALREKYANNDKDRKNEK